MRFPFPERVRYSHALLFATALFGAQMLEGTNFMMAGLVFCFILVSTAAFNIAGGFYYPSGAFIGFNAVLTLVMPMVAKVILLEPAQRNLRVPIRTVEVYLCGMVAMLAGAVFTRKYRPAVGFISNMLPPENLRVAFRGGVVFAIFFAFLQGSAGGGDGSFGSLLNQLNRFPVLAYLLGVVGTVYRTRGKSSLTWPLLLLMLNGASAGLFTFSKEAFLGPFFCWALGCAYMRYKLSWMNWIMFFAGLAFTVTYLVPYAQVGRDSLDDGRTVQEVSSDLIRNPTEMRATYKAMTVQTEQFHDYDTSVPLLDRLDVLAPDDALVEVTGRTGFFGYVPEIAGLGNFVPHFLWPDKPRVYFGNAYGHEIGILADNDFATGLSFSPSADAYHQGGAMALLLLCPVLYSLVFYVLDRIIGDTRLNPVGLVMIVLIERVSAENALPGVLSLAQQSLVAVVFVSYVAKYVLPPIGRLFSAKSTIAPVSPLAAAEPTLPNPRLPAPLSPRVRPT